MRRLLGLFMLALMLPLLHACGGVQEAAPLTDLPTTSEEYAVYLDGRWAIMAADGEDAGSMLFAGPRVTALSQAAWFAGRWHTVPTGRHEMELHVHFAEAGEEGVRMVFGEDRHVVLTLVPVSEESLIVLQQDGLWTRWVRRGAEE